MCCMNVLFFFKLKAAYEMRISDWSSDVCSSDLAISFQRPLLHGCIDVASGFVSSYLHNEAKLRKLAHFLWVELYGEQRCGSAEFGSASCTERVCKYV